jgi:hypothetical protein
LLVHRNPVLLVDESVACREIERMDPQPAALGIRQQHPDEVALHDGPNARRNASKEIAELKLRDQAVGQVEE